MTRKWHSLQNPHFNRVENVCVRCTDAASWCSCKFPQPAPVSKGKVARKLPRKDFDINCLAVGIQQHYVLDSYGRPHDDGDNNNNPHFGWKSGRWPGRRRHIANRCWYPASGWQRASHGTPSGTPGGRRNSTRTKCAGNQWRNNDQYRVSGFFCKNIIFLRKLKTTKNIIPMCVCAVSF